MLLQGGHRVAGWQSGWHWLAMSTSEGCNPKGLAVRAWVKHKKNHSVWGPIPIIGKNTGMEFTLTGKTRHINREKFSGQKPRSTMARKTLEKSGLQPWGTKSSSRSNALRLIDSAKLGFGLVDKMQCFQSAIILCHIYDSSPNFSRVFFTAWCL